MRDHDITGLSEAPNAGDVFNAVEDERMARELAEQRREVFLLGNLFAWQQKQQLVNRRGAIVIAPSAPVKKTPAKNGTDEFVIHEGTRVNITDKSIKDWRGVRLDDGREGWMAVDMIEEI